MVLSVEGRTFLYLEHRDFLIARYLLLYRETVWDFESEEHSGALRYGGYTICSHVSYSAVIFARYESLEKPELISPQSCLTQWSTKIRSYLQFVAIWLPAEKFMTRTNESSSSSSS
jgi:hypothetical protein